MLYTVIYVCFTYDIVKAIWYPDDRQEKPSTVSVIYYLVIAYNLILHAGTLPINLFIVFKEVSLEFF